MGSGGALLEAFLERTLDGGVLLEEMRTGRASLEEEEERRGGGLSWPPPRQGLSGIVRLEGINRRECHSNRPPCHVCPPWGEPPYLRG